MRKEITKHNKDTLHKTKDVKCSQNTVHNMGAHPGSQN